MSFRIRQQPETLRFDRMVGTVAIWKGREYGCGSRTSTRESRVERKATGRRTARDRRKLFRIWKERSDEKC
jgi:hypothetical protein